MGPKKTPFVFAAGQGFLGPIEIRAFDGEQLVPCGFIPDGGGKIWLDRNGDGIQQPDEVQVMTGPGANGIACFDVADNGDIYLGSGQEKVVRKLTFAGISDKGVPRYSGITENPATWPIPAYYGNNWEALATAVCLRHGYDVLHGLSVRRKTHSRYRIVRIDRWNASHAQRYEVSLPTPLDNRNFISTTERLQPQDGFIYMAFDVANDKIFAAEIKGAIHVLDAATGKRVFKILPGPEVSGDAAWEDSGMGIRAHFNKATGTYYITTENSGWAAKINLYRWKPSGNQP